ncbi:Ig-like domain-containing protein [Saccharicrinis sp. FJH62]|uniref:Ig-like domain-containing protein n=1 Tax=Saccharicrinis sp. FJH62 TaxID=3344657 RepID=UPI0035D45094
MKYGVLVLMFLITMLYACEENGFDNNGSDSGSAVQGNIVGKVLQTDSKAKVVVSQVNGIDSTEINPVDGSFEIKNLPVGNYDLTVNADMFRKYNLHNVNVLASGNTYVGEIDLSTVPDLISSHYPEDKSEIIYNNQYSRLTISIIFTQPMDRESVEKAFSTTPSTDGIFHWGQYSTAPNRIYYSNDATNWGYDAGSTITTYSKITAFSYQVSQKDSYVDTTYAVTLSTEAQDTSGNHLRFPLEFSFSTIQSESTQNAILSSPSNGDNEVDLIMTQGIQISFPRNMDQVSTEQALTVSPESDAILIWPAQNHLTIYTGGVLHAETTYDITIGASAKDADGIELGNPFQFSFNTSPVRVTNTSPQNGEVFVSESTAIYFYFNTYMQKSTVQNAISISPSVSGTLDWYGNSKTTMRFDPNQDLQHNKKYTITIGTEAKDLYGTALNEPYTFSFIVRPE